MSKKKPIRDLAIDYIGDYGYLIIAVILAVTLVFAVVLGFGRIDLMSSGDKIELARLMSSITFPMTGILLFVLGQTLSLRKKFAQRNPIDHIAAVYTKMSATSAITLVVSAITGLLSFQYFKSGGDILLIVALYLFLSILTLLIVNTVFFVAYTLGKDVKNMKYYLGGKSNVI